MGRMWEVIPGVGKGVVAVEDDEERAEQVARRAREAGEAADNRPCRSLTYIAYISIFDLICGFSFLFDFDFNFELILNVRLVVTACLSLHPFHLPSLLYIPFFTIDALARLCSCISICATRTCAPVFMPLAPSRTPIRCADMCSCQPLYCIA